MNTKIGVDMNTTNKNCNYLLNEEHVTSWLKQTGGTRLLDGICHNPSRLELAWEALKRSSTVKCVRKKPSKRKTSNSSSSFSKFKFPRFEIISEADHLTNCQNLIDITVTTSTKNFCQLSSMNFAFSKAPIYRVRSNHVEIQHDILHNGPVLSMMKNEITQQLESVKIIGWVKRNWLVQLFTGEVVKVKLGDKTELESNVMAIVPAKLDDPNDPTSAFSLP
jgi:hypothetical protein